MSSQGGPDIVHNGLVLHLDVKNFKCYPRSGNTLYDLGERYNGSLVNSPTYSTGGFFTFNNSNTYISTTATPVSIGIYDADYTAEAVFELDNVSGDNMIFGNIGQGSRAGWHLGTRNTSFYWGHYSADTSAGTPEVGVKYHVLWVYKKGVSSKIWVNGTNVGGNTVLSYIATNNINIGCGSNTTSTVFGGNIHLAKIYNRGLSDEEISQSFSAVKRRFEL